MTQLMYDATFDVIDLLLMTYPNIVTQATDINVKIVGVNLSVQSLCDARPPTAKVSIIDVL